MCLFWMLWDFSVLNTPHLTASISIAMVPVSGEISFQAHESSLQFGRGPKRSEPSLHRYEPATPGHYARWRLDLADSNGIALGDDEVTQIMRNMQLITSDTTFFPPFYLHNRHITNAAGSVVQLRFPVDSASMILHDGHWVGVLALFVDDTAEWQVHLQGVSPEDDHNLWKQAILNMMNLDPANTHWRFMPGNNIPDACGYTAVQFLTNQVQGEWLWEPLQVPYYTGDTPFHSRIYAHIQNLSQYLRAHQAPGYYIRQAVQLRASFLTSLYDAVVVRNVYLGRGPKTAKFEDYGRHGCRREGCRCWVSMPTRTTSSGLKDGMIGVTPNVMFIQNVWGSRRRQPKMKGTEIEMDEFKVQTISAQS